MNTGIARGLALFLGLFTLMNIAASTYFDANLWWIDLWPLPARVAIAVYIAFAAGMIAFACGRREGRAMALVMLIFAIANTLHYYALLRRGEIHTTMPVPLSLFIALALIAIAFVERRDPSPVADMLVSFAIAAIVFPLAQISLFGHTDYRRRADMIVVLGAKAYPNGTLSPPLADRMRTACDLYRAGYAPRMLLSGGPGEPESMRRYAMKRGVPSEAIIEDAAGVNTEATARNTVRLTHGRVLAVSHFYHLPRIKMAFQRHGLDVYTVPSETTLYPMLLFQFVREDAAFWWYWLQR